MLVWAGGKSISSTAVANAELIAVWNGLKEALHHFHITNLIVEGDSEMVINWINVRSLSTPKNNPSLQDVLQ